MPVPYDPSTARYKINSNPRFAPQITGTAMGNLTRGRIINKYDSSVNVAYNPIYCLNFLYNPDSIEIDYSIDTSNATPIQPQYRNPNDTANLPIPLANSLSFSLLFDRTFEVWQNQATAGTPGVTAGVYDDVKILYGLIGVTAQVDSPVFNSSGQQQTQQVTVTGPMQMNECYFYFGGQASLSFYGIIMSASVTYTHWSIDMVPTRCTIALGVNLLSTDATDQQALTIPDRNTASFANNSSNYNYFFYSYNGPNQGQG